jgi:hypothetical protein
MLAGRRGSRLIETILSLFRDSACKPNPKRCEFFRFLLRA